MKVLRKNDSEASDYRVWFEEFYNASFEKFLRYAYAIVGSKSLAEDVVSEVFMIIWTKKLAPSESLDLSAYIARSIRNLALRLKSRQSLENQTNNEIEISHVPDPHNILLGKELEKVIHEVFERLTPHEKLIYDLARNKGLTHEQIANELGISKHTAQKHLCNALKEFRSALQKRFSSSKINPHQITKISSR